MIIAVEGLDAAGKNTQVRLLREKLTPHFDEVATFDFPHYQGQAGGLVGRILRGETVVVDEKQWARCILSKSDWCHDKALIIQCVMTVDRLEFLDWILPFVGTSKTLLILDRYYLAGLVYGEADGLDPVWLRKIHASLPRPDVFYILDISVEESVRRRPERRDYYEKNLDKLQRVRQGYLERHDGVANVMVIDGCRTPEQVADEITGDVLAIRPQVWRNA